MDDRPARVILRRELHDARQDAYLALDVAEADLRGMRGALTSGGPVSSTGEAVRTVARAWAALCRVDALRRIEMAMDEERDDG